MFRNKVIIYFIKLIVFSLSPIVIFLLLFIYPFLKIRFAHLPAERIGECALRMEVYLSEKQIGLEKKKCFDIFILTEKIANKTFIELLKKKIKIYPNFIIHPIYKIIYYCSKHFNFFKKFILQTKNVDNNFSIMRSNINLNPDKQFIKKGEDFLKKIGVPLDSKIICLIVRDNAYLKKKFPEKNSQYHNYRNCNIQNYKDAINFAISKGYYVFRMGETVEENLEIENKNFIDYSNIYRTDFLDIYLAFKSTFCISTSTGWDCVPAYTFRKPMIWTNCVPVGNLHTYSPNFLFSFKIHRSISDKKNLNLKSISKSPVSYAETTDLYKNSGIELIENSPNQIVDLTKEMIELIENKQNYSNEDIENQNIFWEKYNNYFNLENIQKKLPYRINPLLCTSKRLFKNNNISKIGKEFLRENIFLIK